MPPGCSCQRLFLSPLPPRVSARASIMIHRTVLLTLWLLVSNQPVARAQESPLPPGEKEPVLRLEAGGPTSFVTALAFSPDGQTLYVAGFDKVVRSWTWDAAKNE